MKVFSLIFSGLAFLFGLTIVFGSWYTVDQGEKVVVTRNGAIIRSDGPGFHFKTPWLDSITTFDLRTRRSSSFDTKAYSKDIQEATYRMSINYRVNPALVEKVYTELGTDYFERVVAPNILRITKEVSGQYAAADIVQHRDRLGAQITTAMAEELAPAGIIIDQVQIENADFSDAFDHAIEDRMKAEVEVAKQKQVLEQNRVIADKIRIDADAEAYRVQKAAEAAAYQVKQAGDAEAYAVRAKGDAEAQAINKRGEALAKNPQYIELVERERWNGQAVPQNSFGTAPVPVFSLGTFTPQAKH